MTNADKFKSLFGIYATELWAMSEKDFLEWLNSEVSNSSEFPNGWIPCTPETMPEEGILVWVSMDNEVALWRRYNSDWYQDGLTSWVIPVEETDAWMPIVVPDPYQPEEDEL